MAIPGDDTFIEEQLEEAAPDEYGEESDTNGEENESSDAESKTEADATNEDA